MPEVPSGFPDLPVTRREFLCRSGMGMGALALAGVLRQAGLLSAAEPVSTVNPLAPRQPHFPAKAKHVIQLFMAGAPSQLD